MTNLGIIHILSALYLSAVICLAVSVNENRALKRIAWETLRRWLKFLAFSLAIAAVVALVD